MERLLTGGVDVGNGGSGEVNWWFNGMHEGDYWQGKKGNQGYSRELRSSTRAKDGKPDRIKLL